MREREREITYAFTNRILMRRRKKKEGRGDSH
jgi:hypothetical protein